MHRASSLQAALFASLLYVGEGGAALNTRQASAPAPGFQASLAELRKSFTVNGKLVPPEVFRDMGDGDLADSRAIRVTIDVQAAIGSNLYADDIAIKGNWVTQVKPHKKDEPADEQTAYSFIGTTANKLLVVIASYSGGGSGVFYTLHVLDAAAERAFDADGRGYDRLNLTEIRSIPLGDRWQGDVKIVGNSLTITTTGGMPNGQDQKPVTRTVKAERP